MQWSCGWHHIGIMCMLATTDGGALISLALDHSWWLGNIDRSICPCQRFRLIMTGVMWLNHNMGLEVSAFWGLSIGDRDDFGDRYLWAWAYHGVWQHEGRSQGLILCKRITCMPWRKHHVNGSLPSSGVYPSHNNNFCPSNISTFKVMFNVLYSKCFLSLMCLGGVAQC